jgi:hypothetical protein
MIGTTGDFLGWLEEPEDALESYLPAEDRNRWIQMEQALVGNIPDVHRMLPGSACGVLCHHPTIVYMHHRRFRNIIFLLLMFLRQIGRPMSSAYATRTGSKLTGTHLIGWPLWLTAAQLQQRCSRTAIDVRYLRGMVLPIWVTRRRRIRDGENPESIEARHPVIDEDDLRLMAGRGK